MGADFWIHAALFAIVFIATGIVLTRRSQSKNNRSESPPVIDVETEVILPGNEPIRPSWRGTKTGSPPRGSRSPK
jgi:hypothetical protein